VPSPAPRRNRDALAQIGSFVRANATSVANAHARAPIGSGTTVGWSGWPPIGALACAFATDVAFARTKDPIWARASRFLLGAGLGTGALAAPLGLIDLLTIEKARTNPAAWAHGIGNVAAIGLTVANLATRATDPVKGARRGIVMSAITMGMLLVTGWLGGELAYRSHIGMAPDA
jgi:uncharacterized membrane protein